MVKLEVVFTSSNEIVEIKLLDATNLADWSFLLTPLRQTFSLDFTWMQDESKACMKNFDETQLVWYKHMIPYIMLDSSNSSPESKQYEHKSNSLDGTNHVCVYDIYEHRLRIVPAKLPLATQQLKLNRYLHITYNKMCQLLRHEYMLRLILATLPPISPPKSPTIRRPMTRENPNSNLWHHVPSLFASISLPPPMLVRNSPPLSASFNL